MYAITLATFGYSVHGSTTLYCYPLSITSTGLLAFLVGNRFQVHQSLFYRFILLLINKKVLPCLGSAKKYRFSSAARTRKDLRGTLVMGSGCRVSITFGYPHVHLFGRPRTGRNAHYRGGHRCNSRLLCFSSNMNTTTSMPSGDSERLIIRFLSARLRTSSISAEGKTGSAQAWMVCFHPSRVVGFHGPPQAGVMYMCRTQHAINAMCRGWPGRLAGGAGRHQLPLCRTTGNDKQPRYEGKRCLACGDFGWGGPAF